MRFCVIQELERRESAKRGTLNQEFREGQSRGTRFWKKTTEEARTRRDLQASSADGR